MIWVLFIVFGAIVGALARFIGPGRTPGPLPGSMVAGVAGALIGRSIGRLTGFSREDDAGAYLTALIGAVLLAVAYHGVLLRRRGP